MSSNSKDHAYELMLGLGQDLQKQIMKIAQSSPQEPPATAIPKPVTMEKKPQPPAAIGPSIPAPIRPQQFEKKTFEQAYREAVERLNSESINKPGMKNSFSRTSNNATYQSHKPAEVPKPSVSSISSLPSNSISTSSPHYKTTIYNINTINLASLLKTHTQPDSTSGTNPALHALLSPSSSARVMAESSKYRQTYSNAYANHLLELTRNAVEKKSGRSNDYAPITNTTYQKPVPMVPATAQQKKIPKPQLPGLYILNGKDGNSSFVDKSKGPNGTTVLKRNSPSKSTKNEIVFTTPSNVTVVAPLSKSTSIIPSPMPRLKPSSVQTHRDDKRQASVTQPYHVHQLSSPGSAAKSPLPIPGLENRPDLTVIVNKPKITSPAPAHVYGKPTISTTSITPTRTSSVSASSSQNYSVGYYTPKRDANVAVSSYRDPPPAHSVGTTSSYPVSVITKPPQLSDTGRITTHEKTPCTTKPASIIVKASSDMDGVLNLDIKTSTSGSPVSSCSISSDVKPKPPAVSREHGLQPSTSFQTSGQKVAKIEKRVNYDVSVSKPSSNTDPAPKYQQNAIWKEQPTVRAERQQTSSGAIDEQKQKLLELLHNANFQQLYSQAQAHANGAKSAGTDNVVVSSLTKHMSHINRINMELYKYRKGLSSSIGEHIRQTQPVDPLAVKRKDPLIKRSEAPRRKRPKLARSTESYLQNGPCHDVAPRLPRCRECGRSAAARSRDAANIFCRFIAFRKLRYNESGFMEVAGFAEPNLDPQSSDTELWNANLQKIPIDISVEKGKFLLGQVGYKFCELFHQEKEAYFEHMSEDKTIAWKQSVQGVREMCDVCSTTLFNYHWVCSTCGFVVCIDCYKGRKHGARKNDTGTKDRDGYMWLHCTTNKEPHVQEKLMLTQIIPSNSLYKLVRQMHGICALLEIPLNCECPLSKESLFRKIKDRLEFIYPLMVESKSSEENTISSLGSTTKMISISIKSIESKLSETDSGTICCKVIFGRELSAEKNPEAEMLKRRIKQSYSFDGFQEDIRKESLEDFIKASPQYKNGTDDSSIPEEQPASTSNQVEDNTKEEKKIDNLDEASAAPKPENVPKNQSVDDESSKDEEPYSEEHRFKPSPKLDWKTFNMIVKQLLKFDKSINISGLFEQHLTEKCPESESLGDFTADIQVNHSNLQSFLGDFLDEFVFLKGQNKSDNLTDDVLEYNKLMKKSIEFQNKGERVMDLKESEKLYPNVAHQWLCNGRLLRLLDPLNDNNYTTFHDQWERGQPVMVSYVSGAMDMNLWHPESFIRDFGEEENDLINCLNGKLVRGQQMKVFWEGFERIGFRLLDERDRPMILKLKDWPPGDDFAEMMPTRFNDLMKCLPLAEYTRREGRLNLASRLSSFFVRPDLGPKMYSAYGSALHPTKGTTNLHLDVSDAVNVMVYVGVPKDADQKRYTAKVLDSIDTDELDSCTRQRIREKGELPGALWHIYHAKDADKIRSLLNKIEVERGGSIKANHDPIHDQKWYLDANLRRRLLQEYSVEGYAILQCSGDAIFIPAGAPHQVRNLHNCIKVAEDFVSPENISYCFKLTNEFRHLTNTHSNHEDKLQIKNIIYHTVKDAVSCLTNPLILTKGDKIELL